MNPPICVFQVRIASTRLPAKALLNICGYSLLVFATSRASSKGLRVMVAIPDNEQNDILAEHLKFHKISYFRGPEKNILNRFYCGLKEMDSDQCIFRLTPDNILADGGLLSLIYSEFIDRKLEYMSASGQGSGLPKWGTGVEIFKKSVLDQCISRGGTDQENTPMAQIFRKYFGSNVSTQFGDIGLEDLRCTIDTLEDYIYVTSALKKLDDPLKDRYQDMLKAFKSTPRI